jgi:hypothetical protein
MPKNDNNGYGTRSRSQERDIASKGVPTTGTGIPDDNHDISAPYNADLQTQIAAKGKKKTNTQQTKSNKK